MFMKPLPRPARVAVSLLSAAAMGVETVKAVREMKEAKTSDEATEAKAAVIVKGLSTAMMLYGAGYQAAKK